MLELRKALITIIVKKFKDVTIGNHAGNSNMNKLKWLCGIIDSDGCICITMSKRRNNKIVYTPNIVVTNSNHLIIDEVVGIYRAEGISFHVKNNGSCLSITVSRPTHLLKLVALLNPWLITKSKELELLNKFCNSRVENMLAHDNKRAKYSDHEVSLASELKSLNSNHYGECIEYGISEYIIDNCVLDKFNFAWLSGFIDGDGCITINRIKRPNGTYQYQPMLHIVTGSPLSKNVISTFLDLHNVDYYLKKDLPGVNHKANCKSKKFEFYIRSNSMCVKLLSLLNYNMVGKLKRAILLKSFCESRLSNKGAYTAVEIDYYTKIQNDIRDTSTTKSKTLLTKSEDIV